MDSIARFGLDFLWTSYIWEAGSQLTMEERTLIQDSGYRRERWFFLKIDSMNRQIMRENADLQAAVYERTLIHN